MNDLLFIALLIALLYYFFIYLPQKKSHPDPDNKPFTYPKSNQTNPDPKKTNSEETEPGPTFECPGALTIEDKQGLEKTLDYLMKGMHELSQDLDKSKKKLTF